MKFLEKLMNLFDRIIAWFKEYDDELTWFFIGVFFVDGINQLQKGESVSGLFYLFISGALWYFYMRDLKARK